MTETISPELVARMVAHFHAVKAKYAHVKQGDDAYNEELAEVRAIVAELPAPIDPDLLLAREVVVEHLASNAAAFSPSDIRKGDWDKSAYVQIALSAIKQTRAQ